jgi:hypothetical protein
MKRTALWIALMFSTSVSAAPWIYRGTLNDGGLPANGRYDIRLSLLDAGGAKSLAYPLTFSDVEVTHGAFAIDVDFGMDLAQFGALKLKTEVAQGGSGFVALGAPKPFDAKAVLAGVCWDTAGNSGNVAGTNFVGNVDAVPLDLRSSNIRVARLWKPSASSTNVLLGGSTNAITAGAIGASILGGGQDDPMSSVPNTVSEHYGTVGGGLNNHVGNDDGDPVNAQFSTVAGGFGNFAYDYGSVVGGGYGNGAGGYDTGYGSVGGGASNFAAGDFSTVPGGRSNNAAGDYSFAAGRGARVRGPIDTGEVVATCGGIGTCGDEGTFVWADSRIPGFTSSGANQFLIRADGGFHLNDATPASGNDDVTLAARALSGDADFDLRMVTRSGKEYLAYVLDSSGTLIFNPVSLTVGSSRLSVVGGAGGTASLSNGGVWTNASSRDYKERIAPIDPAVVLDKLVALPISRWQCKGSTEGMHLGPMAEDFQAAFGLAGDGKSIGTVDADGVALAAIQGLNAKLEAENATLKSQLATLADRLARLEAGRAP